MIRLATLLIVCMCLGSGAAIAAGPFDGQWKGWGRSGRCRGAVEYTLDVANSKVSGKWSAGALNGSITGTIRPDGAFKADPDLTVAGPMVGKFEANSFKGEAPSANCGNWAVTMERIS